MFILLTLIATEIDPASILGTSGLQVLQSRKSWANLQYTDIS